MKSPAWIQKQTFASNFECINAKRTDPIKDFKLDPSGYYVLIKVFPVEQLIGVALCNQNHEIEKEFRGHAARDLWSLIFDSERRASVEWFTRKDHIAYLGKELAKAETALKNLDISYIQE